MARVPCSAIFLSILLLVIFNSVNTARARDLKEAAASSDQRRPKGMEYKFQSIQDGALGDGNDDLISMDYTPAKRKPPIHN